MYQMTKYSTTNRKVLQLSIKEDARLTAGYVPPPNYAKMRSKKLESVSLIKACFSKISPNCNAKLVFSKKNLHLYTHSTAYRTNLMN